MLTRELNALLRLPIIYYVTLTPLCEKRKSLLSRADGEEGQ